MDMTKKLEELEKALEMGRKDFESGPYLAQKKFESTLNDTLGNAVTNIGHDLHSVPDKDDTKAYFFVHYTQALVPLCPCLNRHPNRLSGVCITPYTLTTPTKVAFSYAFCRKNIVGWKRKRRQLSVTLMLLRLSSRTKMQTAPGKT